MIDGASCDLIAPPCAASFSHTDLDAVFHDLPHDIGVQVGAQLAAGYALGLGLSLAADLPAGATVVCCLCLAAIAGLFCFRRDGVELY